MLFERLLAMNDTGRRVYRVLYTEEGVENKALITARAKFNATLHIERRRGSGMVIVASQNRYIIDEGSPCR